MHARGLGRRSAACCAASRACRGGPPRAPERAESYGAHQAPRRAASEGGTTAKAGTEGEPSALRSGPALGAAA